MALKYVYFDTVTQRLKADSGSALDFRAGVIDVPNGATSVSITFSSALPNLSYAPMPVMLNTTDTYPQYQPLTITNFTVNGFTVSWNAPTDTGNYKITWNCLKFQ